MTRRPRHTRHTKLLSKCSKIEVEKDQPDYYISKDIKEVSKDILLDKFRIGDGIMIIARNEYSEESVIAQIINCKPNALIKRLEDVSLKMKENKIYNGIIVSSAPLTTSAEKVS